MQLKFPIKGMTEMNTFEKSVRSLSKMIVPTDRLLDPNVRSQFNCIVTRLLNILMLLDESVDLLTRHQSRNHALLLILTTDFCWQFLRNLGNVTSKTSSYIRALLPEDYEQDDKDVGDLYYTNIIEISDDADWVYQLHTSIRHPTGELKDHIWLLSDPAPTDSCRRLLRAAHGVRSVLLCVSARSREL